MSFSSLLLLLGAAACAPAPAATPADTTPRPAAIAVDSGIVRRELSALAADSMAGRLTGTPGAMRAAYYIAERMRAIGLRPAGDGGDWFQHVPVATMRTAAGDSIFLLADTVAPAGARREPAVNVVGVLPGSDPALKDEVVLIDAHYDHLGAVGELPAMYGSGAVGGDTIYNGADDDASGTVTVLEIARALAKGPAPKRTMVFLLTTGEEEGLLGTRWYLTHPALPIERMVANLEIEMIGRPDPKVGPGRAWLTGFERSTMGEMFAGAGLPIVADPRPEQHFYQRSDNIAFAFRGIPAHTLSTFGMHRDYHAVTDDMSRIDVAHVTRVIDIAARAARLLADGPKPEWQPGGQPVAQ